MKKIGVVNWILIVLAVLFFAISLCVRSTEAAELSAAPAYTPEELVDMGFPALKSDEDVYKLFADYFPAYVSGNYQKFCVFVERTNLSIYFLHNDNVFTPHGGLVTPSMQSLRLQFTYTTAKFTTRSYAAGYDYNPAAMAYCNFELTAGGTVYMPNNIGDFYAGFPAEKPTEPPTEKPTQKPTEPPTQKPTQKPGDDTAIDYSDQLMYIQAVLVLLVVVILIAVLWKI